MMFGNGQCTHVQATSLTPWMQHNNVVFTCFNQSVPNLGKGEYFVIERR